ncbi:MAG: metal-binding protein [Betaproteobacteria bacterium HGW-Betaproteobacteria-17]|nr:MAG: metal-binding protein [Betaproteobacteria bacterium HGW-Betaproteobacteria-17]
MKNFVASLLVLGLAQVAWAAPTTPVIDVYKSPTCGCCNKWIDHLKANDFTVRAHDTENVVAHKIRLGVPAGYGACHTAEVNGYVIEGHVPAKEITRLLKEKPRARGLVVPAMPVGSPGMEAGGQKYRYDVFIVNRDGSTKTYARY